MMNPTEIADALDEIARAPFDATEFGYAFAQATDNARAAISKLRTTTNKSDQPGGVLLNRKFHYVPAASGMVAQALDALRASKKTATAKPAIRRQHFGLQYPYQIFTALKSPTSRQRLQN